MLTLVMHCRKKKLCTVLSCVLNFVGLLVQVANLFRKSWCKAEQLPKQYKEMIQKLKGSQPFFNLRAAQRRLISLDVLDRMCCVMGKDMGKEVNNVTKAGQSLAWLQHESILEHRVTKWTVQDWMLTSAQRESYAKLQGESIVAVNDSPADLANQ